MSLTSNQVTQTSIGPPGYGGTSMPQNSSTQEGVSNCYVFKSRLQEYAQKMGMPTPVYETIKEGPSHEPSFRSTVIVNDVRYDSLPGFFNRKAAEQSAAEVALVELAKSGEVNQSLAQPIHETGLCKNLLQEYAQKMKYAIPLYRCQKDESPSREPLFKCTVEIGGVKYIGAASKTKREAEIKAARTALLAIQSSSRDFGSDSPLTVIPYKKRGAETSPPETAPKPKKAKSNKKIWKKKLPRKRAGHNQDDVNTDTPASGQTDVPKEQTDSMVVNEDNNGKFASGSLQNSQDALPSNGSNLQSDAVPLSVGDNNVDRACNLQSSSVPHTASDCDRRDSTAADFNQKNDANSGTTSAWANGGFNNDIGS